MSTATADIYDDHPDAVEVASPIFRAFGQRTAFHGPVRTVKVFEDNVLVRSTLETQGEGAVLIVDGGGSTRCALMGDRLATLAIDNGWSGVVVFGCIRDSAVIDGMEVGVRAIATNPRKSLKKGEGEVDVEVKFAGVTFAPGMWAYVDADGILVAERKLSLQETIDGTME